MIRRRAGGEAVGSGGGSSGEEITTEHTEHTEHIEGKTEKWREEGEERG